MISRGITCPKNIIITLSTSCQPTQCSVNSCLKRNSRQKQIETETVATTQQPSIYPSTRVENQWKGRQSQVLTERWKIWLIVGIVDVKVTYLLFPKATGVQGVQFMFSQKWLDPFHSTQLVKSMWLLINTGSIFNLAYNDTLLVGIKEFTAIKSFSNGGSIDYKTSGVLQILPDLNMCFNINSITNMLSISSMTIKYRVTINSIIEDAIMVHTSSTDNPIKFTRCCNGLYDFDTVEEHKTKEPVLGYPLFSTMDENKDYFTRCEIEGAGNNIILQRHIG